MSGAADNLTRSARKQRGPAIDAALKANGMEKSILITALSAKSGD